MPTNPVPYGAREKIKAAARAERDKGAKQRNLVKTKYPTVRSGQCNTIEVMTKTGLQEVSIETLPPVGAYGYRGTPTKLTDRALDRFLDLYKQTGFAVLSAKSIGVRYTSIQNFAEICPAFKVAMAAAKEEAKERLMAEAHRRAMKGYNEPVYYKGKKVGAIRKFSDRLLEKLLEGLVPESFARNPDKANINQGVQVFIQQHGSDAPAKEITPEVPEAEEAEFTDEDNTSVQVATPRLSDASVEIP